MLSHDIFTKLGRVIFFPTTLPLHQTQWVAAMQFLCNDALCLKLLSFLTTTPTLIPLFRYV